MTRTLHDAVRDACLWLPETEEFLSHGTPNFRVRGKSFATYVVNHHGDGRVALWLRSPPGAQEQRVGNEPEFYFVPPYVGPRGWLGVHLDRGLPWSSIAALVREAFEQVAPGSLIAALGKTPRIKAPTQNLTPADLDPLQSSRGQAVLALLRRICLDLPETSEATQFGTPVWRAGKKAFVGLYTLDGRLHASFWAGGERQAMLVEDPRYRIPPYIGHNGWIALDVEGRADADELRELALHSYRHFALKRMLAALR